MRTDPSQGLQPNLAHMLRRAIRAFGQGKLDHAERLCKAVLQHQAENFDALHCLGQISYQRGRLDAALTLIQSALKSDLGRSDGFASLGLVFYSLRQFERAIVSYGEGLRLAPDDPELLNRRGVALLELARPCDALEDFDRVLAADPGHLDALGNRGNALIKLNRPMEALAAYDRALRMAPGNAQLLTNRAVALRRLDRPHEALMSAASALVNKPDLAQARFVESVARLTLGDFSAGWRGYEARWSVGALASQRRKFAVPQWLGHESLDGKTILLHAEQGFGDTIQFVRYAALLAARGASIVLEVQRELVRLLSRLEGVAAVIARGQPLPNFDFHSPLLSLPLAFATELETIPAKIPYIAAADDMVAAWRARLPQGRPLIGLVWAGERSHDNDHNRSMRLESLAPLLGLPGLTFVSLQREVRDADVAFLRDHAELCRIGEEFADFGDTAAVVASLDAVISVDTAVAHLAGAMGKPLYLLLPFAADFRWLRERRDSPWYPSAQLFRQSEFGDWASAVAALRHGLARADFAAAVTSSEVRQSSRMTRV